MTPLEEARALCDEYGFDFWATLHLYSRTGWVIIGPDHVLLAQRLSDSDAFIFLACGKGFLHAFCELAPATLQRVHWARPMKGRPGVKIFNFARLKRLLQSGRLTETPESAGTCAGYSN